MKPVHEKDFQENGAEDSGRDPVPFLHSKNDNEWIEPGQADSLEKEGRFLITIYHNSNCSKSRGALDLVKSWSEASGQTVEIIHYLETPPKESELDALLKKMNQEPESIVRTGEDRYEELGLEGKKLSRSEWIKTLCENPILIERPIVSDGVRALVARPPEKVKELLR